MTAKKPWTWDAAREKDIAFIDKLPALKGYLERVNAEVQNFRRAIIREKADSGYWRDTDVIKWKEGGTVQCDVAEDAPTDDELKAIEAELKKQAELPKTSRLKWPTSVGATHAEVAALRAKLDLADDDPSLFEFRDPQSARGGEVIFIQQRIDNPDAENAHDRKQYRPWSLWSDGHWRAMELDGLLPLFGLEQLKNRKNLDTVFLHEGAKPARYLQQLGADRSGEGRAARAAHPWANDLFAHEDRSGGPMPGIVVHLGWVGGATNPHRADLDPLRKLSPNVRIVIVCDNDHLGIKVISALSRMLMRSLTMIEFDDQFPEGFDLADPFPDKLFTMINDRRVYLGPAFYACASSATWATKMVPTGKKGHPVAVVAAFGAALRDGRPLERFGLEFAAWLPGWFKATAKDRRDKAIAELGQALTPQAGIEPRLAEMLSRKAKPLPDPMQEALRQTIIAAQAALYPHRATPVSRDTIRRARKRYGG